MGSKGGGQTIGYKYYMSLLMGIGRTVSEIVEIKVGGKTAWTGPACRDDNVISIESADLFGGDEKEGGIFGPAKIFWGAPDQTLTGGEITLSGTVPDPKGTILADQPNAKIPELRGITALWFDGEVCSLNPYPKEWKFRARRHVSGWYNENPWYPDKAVIYLSGPETVTYKKAQNFGAEVLAQFLLKGGTKKSNTIQTVKGNIKAANGAHIIYEAVTNPEWGRGKPAELLDENSFIYAANTLCNEGLGLCFFWTRQEDVDQFIQTVLDHIGGALYTDRSTGLLTLRLIRDDYLIADLPTFTFNTGLLNILADDSGSQDIAYNEVVVSFHDPITDTDGEARAQNVGARLAQGSSNSLKKEYPGLPTKELAGRIAVRELVVQSGLKKFKVRLDRSGWRIAPAMPFRIMAPERGIASIVLRASEIVDTSIQDGGYIEISAVEDVFSMPATSMVKPEEPTWTAPVSDPIEADDEVTFELSYFDLLKTLSAADFAALTPDDAYFGVVAAAPLRTMPTYDLLYEDASNLGHFDNAGTFSFTAHARLAQAILPLDSDIFVNRAIDLPADADLLGQCLMIGDERLAVTAVTHGDDFITLGVSRGVADTLPRPHGADAYVYLTEDDVGSNGTLYSEDEVIATVVATRSSTGVLPPEDYPVRDYETMMGRFGRPYPPADLQIDGVSVYTATGLHPEPVLTWVSRNRVVQADQLLDHRAASVAEEAGTSYEVEVRSDSTDMLWNTYPVAGGTFTFTYTAAMQDADGVGEAVRFNVVAIRDGKRSLYAYDVPTQLTGGWDYQWDFNWGA